jgi:hypothetical protein
VFTLGGVQRPKKSKAKAAQPAKRKAAAPKGKPAKRQHKSAEKAHSDDDDDDDDDADDAAEAAAADNEVIGSEPTDENLRKSASVRVTGTSSGSRGRRR